jgi:uncharacterized membrane protein
MNQYILGAMLAALTITISAQVKNTKQATEKNMAGYVMV